MDTHIKYLQYMRKSSEDKKRQAISIPAQESELLPLIESESLKIIDIFKEEHSAKKRGTRKYFNAMIKRIELGDANAILLWNINRLSRNAGDTGIIIDLMDRGLLLEIKTPGQVFRNNPQDKFLLNLFCSQAKYENDSRAIDVKRGLKTKARMGLRPTHALPGYRKVIDPSLGLIDIEPDPKYFLVMHGFFKKLLTEKASIQELYVLARDRYKLPSATRKNTISRASFYNLFRNTFYYGEYEWPVGSGNWYKGKHKPILTKQNFIKLQSIINRKVRPNNTKPADPLPFKKLFTCGECSMSVTGMFVQKRHQDGKTHEYRYYQCTKKSRFKKCSQKTISQQEIENTVLKLLSEICLPPEVCGWIIEKSREILEAKGLQNTSEKKSLEKNLTVLNERYDKLVDMRADGEIDQELFAKKTKKLQTEITNIETLISKEFKSSQDYLDSLKTELNFANTAFEKFKNGNPATKRHIIKKIGGNHIIINKKVVIKPKKEVYGIQKLKKRIKQKTSRLKPLSSLNKRTLDTMDEVSPVVWGQLY